MRRKVGSSFLSVSKTIIIGTLKRNPGWKLSSCKDLSSYNGMTSENPTCQSPKDTESLIKLGNVLRIWRGHALGQNRLYVRVNCRRFHGPDQVDCPNMVYCTFWSQISKELPKAQLLRIHDQNALITYPCANFEHDRSLVDRKLGFKTLCLVQYNC